MVLKKTQEAQEVLATNFLQQQQQQQGKTTKTNDKYDLQQIVKDLDDQNKKEESILEKLYNIAIDDDGICQKIRDFRTGYDDYSILHLSVKCCRNRVSSFLLHQIKMSNFDILFIKMLFIH
jgi:hypothetical protein